MLEGAKVLMSFCGLCWGFFLFYCVFLVLFYFVFCLVFFNER